MTSALPTILSDIQETTDSLREASEQLSGGTSIDLTWLERRVSVFCSQVETLPPEDRESARLALEALNSMLDELETDLRSRMHSFHNPYPPAS